METKETTLRTERGVGMLEDIEYYKYIFKKTEKIACAVFYVLRQGHSNGQSDRVAYDLESTAQGLVDVSFESLKSTTATIEERAINLKYALVAFESKLRIAHSARLLSTEFLEVFIHEIDSVQRSLKKYTEPRVANPLSMSDTRMEGASLRERKPVTVRIERTGVTGRGEGGGPSRRERVLGVLRDKGQATIKDIVEVVTDCSEKTIQRELISLIKDNVIVREGERRWSKYRLV